MEAVQELHYHGIQGNEEDAVTGQRYATYLEEVNSPILSEIAHKINDIQYYMGNTDGANKYKVNMLILTEDGKLYTRSMNSVTSGNNTSVKHIEGDFSELTIKEGVTVQKIATEEGLSLAILSNGEVYGWGYNTYGILGSGYTVGAAYPLPVKLALPGNIEYMSIGNKFAIFATSTGEVYGIGKNDYGQLGTGDSEGKNKFVRCPQLEGE